MDFSPDESSKLNAPETKLGSMSAMLRTARSAGSGSGTSAAAKRRMIADYCKLMGVQIGAVSPGACNDRGLSPRLRQTLRHLLVGDSEKQVAGKLGLSRHTVHIYVKALYRHFNVSSRGELLALCLGGNGAAS